MFTTVDSQYSDKDSSDGLVTHIFSCHRAYRGTYREFVYFTDEHPRLGLLRRDFMLRGFRYFIHDPCKPVQGNLIEFNIDELVILVAKARCIIHDASSAYWA